MKSSSRKACLPRTSSDRLQLARDVTSIDADPNLSHSIPPSILKSDETPSETVLYLAYGSNLSIEKFRGDRGIEPISQVNVYVPELRLTFDLPGVPYLEPCFAGTEHKTQKQYHDEFTAEECEVDNEKGFVYRTTSETTDALESGRQPGSSGFRKDQWHRPLIGVVYEVTLKDYAHIIATEGGGSGYHDIVTTCYPFPTKYSSHDPTPSQPTGTPFKAHTLLSPSKSSYGRHSHAIRPVQSYAQPSARYLKFITDGAAELDFPDDYRAYLASIRPYKITTLGQRVGQIMAIVLLVPFMVLLMVLGRLLADENGVMPRWLAKVFDTMRESVWWFYDVVLRKTLGDGERSIGDI